MATIAFIHGAGSSAEYWAWVLPGVERAGHRCVAAELPSGSDDATFVDYADAVIDQAGPALDVVVAQSMGAFTAPLVADRCRSRLIVLVAPMIPAPGETAGAWFEAAGVAAAQAAYAAAEGFDPAFDLRTTFLHDVPPALVEELTAAGEPAQSPAIFGCAVPAAAWPAIPTEVVAAARDRFLPLPLVRRLARERLHVEPELIDSGHLPGFARPGELAEMLLALLARHGVV